MSNIKDLNIEKTIKYYNVDSEIDEEEHSFLIPIDDEAIAKIQQETKNNSMDGELHSSKTLETLVREFIAENDEDPDEEFDCDEFYYHSLLFSIDQDDCDTFSKLRNFEPAKEVDIDEAGFHFSNNRETLEKCPTNFSGTFKIPYGVTSIDANAFRFCGNLTSVEIPDTVTSIGFNAFLECKSLKSIEIPSSVISIGENAFGGCTSLTSIAIPKGVTVINGGVFSGCKSLTSVSIPEGVNKIEDYAFYACSSLTSITIPKDVMEIGNFTFSDCSSLTSIKLPDEITFIGTRTFFCCTNLEIVNIPDKVEHIDVEAFEGCKKLTSISIPSNVKTIREYALKGCESITSLVIPDSVVSIGEGITNACKRLESIVVATENPVYDSRNNCNAIIETAKNKLIAGCKSTKILDGIESIGAAALGGCDTIENIVLPESVKYIEYGAFSDCDNLRSVTIPATVIGIGAAAKSYTREMPRGFFMFTDAQPFNSCPTLTSVTVCKDNPVYDSREDCNAIIETATNKLIVGCQSTKIPSSITEIGHKAFYSCPNLKSIDLPDGLTVIGSAAFSECDSLESITIPGTVTHIEREAFDRCTNLKSVYLPKSITDIEHPNFYFCPELTIYIPKGKKKKFSRILDFYEGELEEMDK